jgi:hypothetical protein
MKNFKRFVLIPMVTLLAAAPLTVSQTTSPTSATSQPTAEPTVEVTEFLSAGGQPLSAPVVFVLHGKAASEVIKLFPTAGQGLHSPVAAGAVPRFHLRYQLEGNRKVHIMLDHSLKTWSEGDGTWDLAPDSARTLERLLSRTQPAAS